MSTPTDMPADPFVQQSEPEKYRLTDDEVATLGAALSIASVQMRASAAVAQILGADYEAQVALRQAEEFERLLVAGNNVTRITVRF